MPTMKNAMSAIIDYVMETDKEGKFGTFIYNDEIINIINEEAGAYYSGQKGVDNVVSVIQNRIKLYVDENM